MNDSAPSGTEVGDVARDGIRLGRAYAKYGLKIAATWVGYAGEILAEVSELLRDQAAVVGRGATTAADESTSPGTPPETGD